MWKFFQKKKIFGSFFRRSGEVSEKQKNLGKAKELGNIDLLKTFLVGKKIVSIPEV